MKELLIRGHVGLGDTIYQRPFIPKCGATHIATPWPEAFWDMDVVCVKQTNGLRTQELNARSMSTNVRVPIRAKQVSYVPGVRQYGMNVMDALASSFGCDWGPFELPLHPSWIEEAQRVISTLDLGGRELAIVHPPTLRREWLYPSRNPNPVAFRWIMEANRDRFFFLSVGHISGVEEWFDGIDGGWDAAFNHGELRWTTIAALMHLARISITAPGFFIPLGIATKSRVLSIFGGLQPNWVLVHSRMDLSTYRALEPEPFCHCEKKDHDCEKHIPRERVLEAFDGTLLLERGTWIRPRPDRGPFDDVLQ